MSQNKIFITEHIERPKIPYLNCSKCGKKFSDDRCWVLKSNFSTKYCGDCIKLGRNGMLTDGNKQFIWEYEDCQ